MPSGKSENLENKQEENANMSERSTVKYLIESLQTVQKENELLKMQLVKYRQVPSGKIGFLLLAVGALALVASVIAISTLLAFIGLGLTFWGALFLFIRPIKFVRGSLLDSTVMSSYTTIDRIIDDLGYKGKALYIPPFPKGVYLPEYLKGLKEIVVLISAEDTTTMPTFEEMATRQFILENPKGICVNPPGFGIMNMLEDELRTDFAEVALESLPDTLPKPIVTSLELARNVEIRTENHLVHVKIEDSAYKSLYSPEHKLKSIHLIGCPLASAIACALSKATGKPVTITKDAATPDFTTIELWYQTLET